MKRSSHSIFNGIRGVWKAWTEPRSTDRDEAFRERSIRVTTGIIIVFTLLSLVSSILFYHDEWTLISFPMFHVFGLAGFFTSALTVARRHIFVSGWLLTATVSAGSGGIILLARQENSHETLAFAIPVFMLAVVVGTLILPRSQIILVSTLNIIIYALTMFVAQTGDGSILNLTMQQQIVSIALLFLIEGAFLQQLRTEFDARLEQMRISIEQAENARQQAELAKQQAEAARKRAELADQAKSQFLANMSHELRTPLNAVIGYDEAMLGGMVGEFTPQQKTLLGHIQHNSRRLLALINDVLDLSKIESGSLKVYLSPIEPRKVIEDTVTSLHSLADQKHLYLQVHISDNVPKVIISDSKKIEQILVNLVSNSIKFTEEGGVLVEVVAIDASNWQLIVSDTGVGIAPEDQKLIFDPFQQADGSLKRKHGGTGLGLSITAKLAEILGGTVEVESNLGHGATFTVTLPRVQESAR